MPLKAVRDGDDWLTRVHLPGWENLIRSDNETMMAVLLPDEEDPELPPGAEQLTAGEFLERHSNALLTPVLAAMRAHYDAMRPRFLDFLEQPAVQMPPAPTLREFVALHDLRQIYIHRPTNAQPARIGFLFGAAWEIEHGVGVLIEGMQVIDCGGADISFS